jgi:hypothetical protein
MATYRGVRHSACGAQLVTKDDNILSPKPSQEIYKVTIPQKQVGKR